MGSQSKGSPACIEEEREEERTPRVKRDTAVVCRVDKATKHERFGFIFSTFLMFTHSTYPSSHQPRFQRTMSDLPSAVKSPSEVRLNVFVPLDTLRRAVEEGASLETDFPTTTTTTSTAGLRLDGVHTGRMLFGTGLHHAMTIEHASVTHEATALFGTVGCKDVRRTDSLAAMKRTVLRALRNTRAAGLLHLHCSAHYYSLQAGQRTSVEGTVVSGSMVATALPIVLDMPDGAVLYTENVDIKRRLEVGTVVWLALRWDGRDVVVDGVDGVPALSAREALLQFHANVRTKGLDVVSVAVFANPVDTMPPPPCDAFRACTTSAELRANAMSAAIAHDAHHGNAYGTRRCPLYVTQNGGPAFPFSRVALTSHRIQFEGQGETLQIYSDRFDAHDNRSWARLVEVCERAGVEHVKDEEDEEGPPTAHIRRCSEKELNRLNRDCLEHFPDGSSCLPDAWEVVDRTAQLAFDRKELRLAEKGRVDRVLAVDCTEPLERKGMLRCEEGVQVLSLSRQEGWYCYGWLLVYDVLLAPGKQARVLDTATETYVSRSPHFPECAWFAAPRKRCLLRYFICLSTHQRDPEAVRSLYFEVRGMPRERTIPTKGPDLKGDASLSDVLDFIPEHNVLVSADPVTHAPFRYRLVQEWCGWWRATLCAELTMTPEWYDVYHAYRLAAPWRVEKELWGLHPYVHPARSGVFDCTQVTPIPEITFPGFDAPALSWLMPPCSVTRDSRSEVHTGYCFTADRDTLFDSWRLDGDATGWKQAYKYIDKYPTNRHGPPREDPLAPVCVFVRYRVVWQDAVQYERDCKNGVYVVTTRAQFLPVGAVCMVPHDTRTGRSMVGDTSKNPTRYYNQKVTYKST